MSNGKMEGMLTQLITMVGTIQSDQQEIKADIKDLKTGVGRLETRMDRIETRMDQIETRMDSHEATAEKRHHELLKRFQGLESDQDFIWEKTVRNERELNNLKRKLG